MARIPGAPAGALGFDSSIGLDRLRLILTIELGLCGVVLDFDAQRFKELQILIADFELGVAGEGGY